ncbi:xanthine dehydrogenase family protein molybdopterin-binding subunit [Bradyrhizobium sp. LHD-71]|uniref:xanthine dehydrogenase family protein molybdopterin-binding subunit n=1 Tax=Bradyrhizobium sp. LHD-71 TaxID=3072141 RepID=UPI00280CA389|nr:xanthine dehydrogenase family protein molybdopterin-binding subunit [Bradyrhizobium sp. LHD-71]MDQ8728726.1 xanthine dehydrogenase family protein molybdopterin-binding subunit [Bradyrhizobium sp. LHD-71]
MSIATELSRRNFLKTSAAAAGGLALGFHVPFTPQAVAQTETPEINAWVMIKPDDTVVVRIARVEMGQGTLTGLAQLVAEELECDWAKVTTEYPTPGQNVARSRVWGNFQTAGSRGIRDSHEYVRKGGAAARMMLVQAAANEWHVEPSACTVAKGVITHAASGRSTTFGKVANAASKLQTPNDIPLKDAKSWTIAGKPLKRLDTPDKINGKLVYAIDVQFPGMLNAALKNCPVFGGKIKSFDAAKVEQMPGVKKVVQVADTGVAVIADTWWRAKTALDALPIEWDNGPNGSVQSADIAAAQKEGLTATEAFLGNRNGDARAELASAARRVEAVYGVPHQHHVTMEPMNATVRWTPDKCEVWTSTQNAESALATAAQASGLPTDKNEVFRHHLGGGFGRRSTSHDFVRYAVLIARQMPGTPVKTIWSREEDMTHGWYHPTTQCRMVGGFDANGELTALHMRISGQSILATVNPNALQNGRDAATFQGLNPQGPEGQFGYTIPNLLIDHAMRNPHVPPGFWRGVNNNQNAIYLESFIDELAHSAKQDPLEFRRKLMANHPKHLAVLNAVAEKVGWGTPPAPGVFRGLAQHMGYGSYVAACAEVSVSDAGVLKIHRIVGATDCGHAVNPQQIEAQVEGSFVYGLTAMLYGDITVKDGRVEQENFDTYQMMRMDEMPVVESIIIPSGGFWGGVGEPTICVAAPAVLNAIFAATGKRIRQMPLSKADLRKA